MMLLLGCIDAAVVKSLQDFPDGWVASGTVLKRWLRQKGSQRLSQVDRPGTRNCPFLFIAFISLSSVNPRALVFILHRFFP